MFSKLRRFASTRSLYFLIFFGVSFSLIALFPVIYPSKIVLSQINTQTTITVKPNRPLATIPLIEEDRLSLKDDSGNFVVPPLGYDFHGLEPYIDGQTMTIHHDRHHQGYVERLNEAISSYPELKQLSLPELLSNLNSLPSDIRSAVRNSGGGHLNHSIFWSIMTPFKSQPNGELSEALISEFDSLSNFQQEFETAGKKHFGSGWIWLVLTPSGQLEITTTANQDSPLMEGKYPIMGNDLWEHAYYLKYQNNRGDYLRDWWNVVDWEKANSRYKLAFSEIVL